MKNYTTFKCSYVLIEDSKNKYQPFYKEFPNEIPNINLCSPSLCCPFSNARRSNLKTKKKPNIKSGYCEVCFTKFDNYEAHVETKDHRDFGDDDNNFKKVDLFIADFQNEKEHAFYVVPPSPCDKLEELLRSNEYNTLINYTDSESHIRISEESESAGNEPITFEDILYNIGKKTRKD